jgi:ubiquinone/menaquinone biosynthesis C-methylase UbiE
MDAENLLFENDSFDIIYSWGVLHHTPDMQKAIDEIYRVLKPEGKVIIMMYNRYSLVGLQLYILHGLLKLKPFIN